VTGRHDLVLQEDAPLTLIEQLTHQFYAWERRGRGWKVWDEPVHLEPPFRPFHFHALPPPPSHRTDDARKSTFLSSLTDGLLGALRGGAPAEEPSTDQRLVEWEPDPDPFDSNERLIEIQVTIPPDLTVSKDAAEQYLLSLPASTWPVAFEIVGTAEAILVQVVCRESDANALERQLASYFPEVVLRRTEQFLSETWYEPRQSEPVIVDFGLSHEFMRPLRTFGNFSVDPLIGVTGALEGLCEGETALLQVLLEPARHPWAESALRAVTGPDGKPFFLDAPEMVPLAREKVARPLFAATLRIAAQSPASGRAWTILRGLGGALRQFARPTSNELIPLANEDYPDDDHEEDLIYRESHRSGMLLNIDELVSLVHLPSLSVRSSKLVREWEKTKAAPGIARGHALALGENRHAGEAAEVSLPTTLRLRHTHVVGATGTGKSHLLLQLIRQGLEDGEGLAVFDPHGDLIEDALAYVPEARTEDVVLVDPADEAFPIGFNVLEAHTALERNLLASDLVALFRRMSTSWGDQMTSILGNAVLAFLESNRGGTLVDLRRFLVDQDFRKAFLPTVDDPEVVFYWEREFPMLRKGSVAPLLTRLDAFLRPKPIRYMVGQKESGLDLGRVMNEGKVLFVKLAHGLIGEENGYLLGTLLVSKLHQLAMARQAVAAENRRPFFVYLDEFHHFVTPSMAGVLTSGRKYAIGLTLAHQSISGQLARNDEVAAAVMGNPATRTVFRVGEQDARKLAEGFAFFEAGDLTKLGVGEAIARVERADWDFNLRTHPLPEVDPETARGRREAVRTHSRRAYGAPRERIEAALRPPEVAQTEKRIKKTKPAESAEPAPESDKEAPESSENGETVPEVEAEPEAPKPPSARPEKPPPMGKGGSQHVYLQNLIKRWADARGWRATIEAEILGGLGSVDVALEREGMRIACEISVSSSPEQELGNVQKCLAAEFAHVVVVATEPKALRKARKMIHPNLDKPHQERVHFLTPEDLFAFLEGVEAETAGEEETVRGYKVKTRYKSVDKKDKEAKRQAIGKVILDAVKRLGRNG